MADPNHLASWFEGISLEPTKHVLEIEYPVSGLLPPDTEPLLAPPVELSNRQAPPHDQTRAGVSQSRCRIHIPVEEPLMEVTASQKTSSFPNSVLSRT
jgi:hypothetical protein